MLLHLNASSVVKQKQPFVWRFYPPNIIGNLYSLDRTTINLFKMVVRGHNRQHKITQTHRKDRKLVGNAKLITNNNLYPTLNPFSRSSFLQFVMFKL